MTQADGNVVALRPEELTEERLADLVGLFDEVTGASHAPRWASFGPQVEEVRAELARCSRWEWRFGAPGRDHAKLVIRDLPSGLILPELDPNDDGPQGYPLESRQMRERFDALLRSYLRHEGIDIETTRY